MPNKHPFNIFFEIYQTKHSTDERDTYGAIAEEFKTFLDGDVLKKDVISSHVENETIPVHNEIASEIDLQYIIAMRILALWSQNMKAKSEKESEIAGLIGTDTAYVRSIVENHDIDLVTALEVLKYTVFKINNGNGNSSNTNPTNGAEQDGTTSPPPDSIDATVEEQGATTSTPPSEGVDARAQTHSQQVETTPQEDSTTPPPLSKVRTEIYSILALIIAGTVGYYLFKLDTAPKQTNNQPSTPPKTIEAPVIRYEPSRKQQPLITQQPQLTLLYKDGNLYPTNDTSKIQEYTNKGYKIIDITPNTEISLGIPSYPAKDTTEIDPIQSSIYKALLRKYTNLETQHEQTQQDSTLLEQELARIRTNRATSEQNARNTQSELSKTNSTLAQRNSYIQTLEQQIKDIQKNPSLNEEDLQLVIKYVQFKTNIINKYNNKRQQGLFSGRPELPSNFSIFKEVYFGSNGTPNINSQDFLGTYFLKATEKK